MEIKIASYKNQNTTQIQGIGHVYGTPAGELTIGSTMVWNGGETSEVVEILRETPKMITFVKIYF